MILEEKLDAWLKQPGTFVTPAERQFIADMRQAASAGVGYGWMQQVIEWEWQSKGPGALGPEYYRKQIESADKRDAIRRDFWENGISLEEADRRLAELKASEGG